MNYSQTKQITRLKYKSPISDVRSVDGILYFTVDLEKKGKQRWKNNGISSAFVSYV